MQLVFLLVSKTPSNITPNIQYDIFSKTFHPSKPTLNWKRRSRLRIVLFLAFLEIDLQLAAEFSESSIYSLFVSLVYCGWKYCLLIYYERKILLDGYWFCWYAQTNKVLYLHGEECQWQEEQGPGGPYVYRLTLQSWIVCPILARFGGFRVAARGCTLGHRRSCRPS
jgi:hypothetical protein